MCLLYFLHYVIYFSICLEEAHIYFNEMTKNLLEMPYIFISLMYPDPNF